MRTSTLANMLLLCGLTAATVGFSSGTAASPQANTIMTANDMLSNDAMSNTVTTNEAIPTPTPTPGMTTNELSPKPM